MNLSGYKTYLVAFAFIVYAIVIEGWQNNNWNSAIEIILTALGFGALRSGIKTVGS